MCIGKGNCACRSLRMTDDSHRILAFDLQSRRLEEGSDEEGSKERASAVVAGHQRAFGYPWAVVHSCPLGTAVGVLGRLWKYEMRRRDRKEWVACNAQRLLGKTWQGLGGI